MTSCKGQYQVGLLIGGDNNTIKAKNFYCYIS